MNKQVNFYVILLLAITRVAFTQTTIPLAGACTDCAAVITAFNNCSVASAGTLQAGTVVGAGVTQTIQLTVGKVGKYNLTTTQNGITFAASGTFTTLGLQTVVLTATGYAISGGVTTFTLSSNGQSCTFDRTVGGATALITGPCSSNLKWEAISLGFGPGIDGDRDGGFGMSSDSVLYGLPGGIYGKSYLGYIDDLEVPDGMIISPTQIQNVPKIVKMSKGLTGTTVYCVGVDGNIYALRLGFNEVFTQSGFTFPYSYVGKASPYDVHVSVVKFPLPPTGTKWVDVMDGSGGGSNTLYGLTDLGEVYAMQSESYQNGTKTAFVKLPTPLGTDPATFKYTKFQNQGEIQIVSPRRFVMLKGNDGNYYDFGLIGKPPFPYLGWGEEEQTAPTTDFDFIGSAKPGYPTVSSQIRKVKFPAGIVLADGSDSFTEDGRKFVWGAIVSSMNGAITSATAPVYFNYPLNDGDYSISRPDFTIVGSTAYCATPREVALPPGATKFISQEFIPGRAAVATRTQVADLTGTKGSTPFIALADNGSYGYYPDKVNYPPLINELKYMDEAASITTPAGAKIYYPKYVLSHPDFAAFHIPLDAFRLGLDGTAYKLLWTQKANDGSLSAPAVMGAGAAQVRNRSVLIPRYSTLLNGSCDFNNPYPEP